MSVSDNKAVTKDWGFSALVEHDGKRILFDSGNNPEIFEHNVKALNVDLTKIDFAAFLTVTRSRFRAEVSLKINPDVNRLRPRRCEQRFWRFRVSRVFLPGRALLARQKCVF